MYWFLCLNRCSRRKCSLARLLLRHPTAMARPSSAESSAGGPQSEQSGRAAEPSGMTYRMSLSACRYKLLLGVDARKWNSMGLRRQVSQNAAQLRHKRTVLSELRPAASSGSFAEQPVYLLCAEREEALHCNTMSEDGYLSTCKQIATYRVER